MHANTLLDETYAQTCQRESLKVREQAVDQTGWDIFNALGREAQPGELSDAAVKHDTYLYGKTL